MPASITNVVLPTDLHSQVVLGGCSAGALGVYLHCDTVAELLGPAVRTRCFADAGFFPDVASVSGQDIAAQQFRTAFDFMNASSGVDQSCLAYASLAVQFHPHGGQFNFDFVWLSARTMHPHVGAQYVW